MQRDSLWNEERALEMRTRRFEGYDRSVDDLSFFMFGRVDAIVTHRLGQVF